MPAQHSPTVHLLNPIGFYRALECARLLSVAKSTWHLWVSNKILNGVDVPQPIKLSAGVTVWERKSIHEFIEQLAAQANTTTTPPRAA